MKLLLKIWLLLIVCASAYADNYLLVGQARLTGFDVLARKMTLIAQQAAPQAKALPAIMIAAMSLNPDFSAFDLTDPILINYYVPVAKNKAPVPSEGPLWCLCVSLSSDATRAPTQLRLMGKDAYIRILGNKALISWSQPLLQSLNMPPSERNGDHDLYLWLNSGEYCRNLPGDLQQSKDFLLRELMAPFGTAGDDALKLRLEYLEKVLRQSGETEVMVDMLPQSIRVDVRMAPEKDSLLGGFIAAQQTKPHPLPPCPDATVAIVTAFVPFAPAVKGVNDFCGALSQWDKAKEYHAEAEFFRALFAGCNGQGVMTVEIGPQGGEQIFATVGTVTVPELKTFQLDQPTGLYRISPDKAKRTIYVRPEGEKMAIAAGKLDSAAEAQSLIKRGLKSRTVPVEVDPTMFAVGAWRNMAGEDALMITAQAPAGALVCHGELKLPLLKVIFPRVVRSIGDAAAK